MFGRRPVIEALSGTRSLHKIWLQIGTGGPAVNQIVQAARAKGIPVEWVHAPVLSQRLGPGPKNHQGVVAQASAVAYADLDDFLRRLAGPAVVVGLDEIQDPQNIGAILRSAAFFGAAGVLLPRWRSAPVSEAAARVSSGAVEHVPVMRIRNLADAILDLKEAGFEVIGADMAGDPLATHAPGPRTALILGSEGQGLRRLVRERCDKLLGIPGRGPVASLNVAASAAIFLHALTKTA